MHIDLSWYNVLLEKSKCQANGENNDVKDLLKFLRILIIMSSEYSSQFSLASAIFDLITKNVLLFYKTSGMNDGLPLANRTDKWSKRRCADRSVFDIKLTREHSFISSTVSYIWKIVKYHEIVYRNHLHAIKYGFTAGTIINTTIY